MKGYTWVNLINLVIHLNADGRAGIVGGKFKGELSNFGVTNAGRLSSAAKAVVKSPGRNVTKAATATVEAG